MCSITQVVYNANITTFYSCCQNRPVILIREWLELLAVSTYTLWSSPFQQLPMATFLQITSSSSSRHTNFYMVACCFGYPTMNLYVTGRHSVNNFTCPVKLLLQIMPVGSPHSCMHIHTCLHTNTLQASILYMCIRSLFCQIL